LVPSSTVLRIDLASVVIGAAVAITAAVIGILLRRRAHAAPPPEEPAPPPARPARPTTGGGGGPAIAVVRSVRRVTGGLEVATSGMVCPTCRTEYAGMQYCQRDARRLVSAEDMLEGRSTGGMCPRCGRAFDPGLRRCPHDGAELVPPQAYRATRSPPPAPTGVLAKVCPVCRQRFDLSARFCGRDGHDLVVVN
jgi:hypothetical protein